MADNLLHVVARVAILASLAACTHGLGVSPGEGATAPAVTGTVTYRERIALPQDAVVEVRLNEVLKLTPASSDTGPRLISGGEEIASTVVSLDGRQVPLPFTLRYDPAKIRKARVYALSASIRSSSGGVLFTTNRARSVITEGNPTHVDLVLSRPVAVQISTELVGSKWVLESLNGASVLDVAAPTLEFPERGKVAGTGSCNRFFGTVDISDSSITFGAIGSTRMACASAISLQEADYFKALESADRFTIEPSRVLGGATLSIYGRSSATPLRFKSVIRVRS